MADDPVISNAKDSDFVHLHLHTEYSLLDGSVRVRDLMHRSASLGMPAVALTDHGNLFGAIEFYQTAKKYDVKPLVGCELYLTPPGVAHTEKRKLPGERKTSHLTVLAQSAEGFANLTKLVSLAHLDGFYYKPRVDRELLAEYAKGVICLSGCLQGEINQFIQDDMLAEARKSIGTFMEIFGKDRFFLEIQDHGMEAQKKCTRQLLQFAREFGLPVVATNDVHFLNRDDHDGHDVLICIGTNRMVLDENRMRYSPEMYFKSADEMKRLFREVPEAIANTLRVAEMCDIQIKLDSASIEKYPVFDAPDGSAREEYFSRVSREGLERRYGERVTNDPELLQRLEYEISIMSKMGFISYFLIVWDFIKWAKDHGIPVGPGRGSAAGSLVAYSLGITDICPLRFGLIFERFLNPERISPPDVDVDFCQNRRPEVIEYVRQKYGDRSVAHIITFGTLGAKSVLRDVSRVMGLSYDEGDRIAKMIPNELNITLAEARQKNPELQEAIEREQATREVFEAASFLEGLKRGTGVHAAGVVIADRDLTDLVALTRSKEGVATTQYAMEPLTELGMLKMDFLGLKTLTVVQDAVELIRVHSPDFDPSAIPLDDPATFELLNRGETCGVFQLESGGMVNLCKQFDVRSIDDVIALIALYRPGPMDFIPSYIARKKGKEQVAYPHPLYEEIARETYGILIYQEQVQRAANVLAGYTLGEADLLRRAMGKKKKSIMDQERIKFVEGAKRVNGIPSQQANEIFDTLAKFAEYGFNKSHSAAYGFISYQTAYLKANFPVEFMAGLLSNEINNTDKISVFVAECQRMGIRILPPDLNKSRLKFAPEPGKDRFGDPIRAIRFGLAAIKNVGEGAMELTVKERNAHGAYQGLDDYTNRVDCRTVNKKILESLVRAGAFDFVGPKRSQIFARIESCLGAASSAQRDRNAGQGSLFGFGEMMAAPGSPAAKEEDDLEEWSQQQRLADEKDLLGFYVTGHPLDAYRMSIRKGNFKKLAQIDQMPESREVLRFAALINESEIKYSKRDGKPFAILALEDFSGTREVVIFGETYAANSRHLLKGSVIQFKAVLEKDRRGEGMRLAIQEIAPLKAIPFDPAEFERKSVEAPIEPLEVVLDASTDSVSDLQRIHAIARSHRGHSPLRLRVHVPGTPDRVILAHRKYWINATEEAKTQLSPWLNA